MRLKDNNSTNNAQLLKQSPLHIPRTGVVQYNFLAAFTLHELYRCTSSLCLPSSPRRNNHHHHSHNSWLAAPTRRHFVLDPRISATLHHHPDL